MEKAREQIKMLLERASREQLHIILRLIRQIVG